MAAGPWAGAAGAWGQAADMPGDRLRRILAELSDGENVWPAARLCAVGPQLTGMKGAGVMLMSDDVPRGSLCSSD